PADAAQEQGEQRPGELHPVGPQVAQQPVGLAERFAGEGDLRKLLIVPGTLTCHVAGPVPWVVSPSHCRGAPASSAEAVLGTKRGSGPRWRGGRGRCGGNRQGIRAAGCCTGRAPTGRGGWCPCTSGSVR